MQTNNRFTIPSSFVSVFLIGFAAIPASVSAQDRETLGYGTVGISAEVDDPGLGSISMFGMPEGTEPNRLQAYTPGRVKVAADNPTGISDAGASAWDLGYGTKGIARQVADPGLGSISAFGLPGGNRSNALEAYRAGRVSVAGDNPTGLSDSRQTGWGLGYGTRGIAERVEHPGPGSRSMFGNPQ